MRSGLSLAAIAAKMLLAGDVARSLKLLCSAVTIIIRDVEPAYALSKI